MADDFEVRPVPSEGTALTPSQHRVLERAAYTLVLEARPNASNLEAAVLEQRLSLALAATAAHILSDSR